MILHKQFLSICLMIFSCSNFAISYDEKISLDLKIKEEILARELFLQEYKENKVLNKTAYFEFKNDEAKNKKLSHAKFLDGVYSGDNPEKYLLNRTVVNEKNTKKASYENNKVPIFLNDDTEGVYRNILEMLGQQDKILTCNEQQKLGTNSQSPFSFCITEVTRLPVPNFDEIIKVFCRDSKSDSCINYIKSKKDDLKTFFPKLTIKSIQQNLNVGSNFLPLLDRTSTIIKEKGILIENVLPIDTFYFDDKFKNCMKNNNCQFIKINGNPLLLESIQHEAFEIFKKVILDYKCEIQKLPNSKNNIYLKALNAVKEFTDKDKIKSSKKLIRPIYKVKCSFVDKKKLMHYNLLFGVDALNGRIISKSKQLNTILENDSYSESRKGISCDTPTNSSCEINSNNKQCNARLIPPATIPENNYNKIITDFNNFYHLSQSMICKDEIPIINSSINLFVPKDCNDEKMCVDYTFACSKPKLLCFRNDDVENIHFNTDSQIITHETAHSIIPIVLKNHKSRENLRILFHDLADTFSNIYTATNCIGSSLNDDNSCTKSVRLFPRVINEEDDIYHFAIIKNGEYPQGEVASYMFNKVYDTFVNKDLNENEIIYQRMKHWMRTFRTVQIFNYNKSPCLKCDNDFYLGLQNLMKSYLIQLIDTDDIKFKDEILYNWSESGFLTNDIHCFSENLADITCPPPKNKRVNSEIPSNLNTGIDNLILSKFETKNNENIINIKLKTATGFKFNFRENIELVKNKCNKYIKISISDTEGKKIVELKRKIKTSSENANCNYSYGIPIKNKEYLGQETYDSLKAKISSKQALIIKATTMFDVNDKDKKDYLPLSSN